VVLNIRVKETVLPRGLRRDTDRTEGAVGKSALPTDRLSIVTTAGLPIPGFARSAGRRPFDHSHGGAGGRVVVAGSAESGQTHREDEHGHERRSLENGHAVLLVERRS